MGRLALPARGMAAQGFVMNRRERFSVGENHMGTLSTQAWPNLRALRWVISPQGQRGRRGLPLGHPRLMFFRLAFWMLPDADRISASVCSKLQLGRNGIRELSRVAMLSGDIGAA